MSLAVPLTQLAELEACESRLAHDLGSRDPDWALAPSALPGWTRAHVVAHLAGNAEALRNLVTWAASGVETPMYASQEVRAADIERRSALPWSDLLRELSRQSAALGEAFRGLTEPVRERHVRQGSGAVVNVCDLAAIRIQEVEIHRVDLAAEHQSQDWSPAFTTRTLDRLTPFFRHRREVPVQVLRSLDTGTCWVVGDHGPDLVGSEAALLAWLIGRPHEQINATDGTPPPQAPVWV